MPIPLDLELFSQQNNYNTQPQPNAPGLLPEPPPPSMAAAVASPPARTFTPIAGGQQGPQGREIAVLNGREYIRDGNMWFLVSDMERIGFDFDSITSDIESRAYQHRDFASAQALSQRGGGGGNDFAGNAIRQWTNDLIQHGGKSPEEAARIARERWGVVKGMADKAKAGYSPEDDPHTMWLQVVQQGWRELPGTGLFYNFASSNDVRFMDSRGNPVSGDPSLVEAAKAQVVKDFPEWAGQLGVASTSSTAPNPNDTIAQGNTSRPQPQGPIFSNKPIPSTTRPSLPKPPDFKPAGDLNLDKAFAPPGGADIFKNPQFKLPTGPPTLDKKALKGLL